MQEIHFYKGTVEPISAETEVFGLIKIKRQ